MACGKCGMRAITLTKEDLSREQKSALVYLQMRFGPGTPEHIRGHVKDYDGGLQKFEDEIMFPLVRAGLVEQEGVGNTKTSYYTITSDGRKIWKTT